MIHYLKIIPGALDVSATTVVATGGNIIRNCGSGIDAYATGKITTQNNIILGSLLMSLLLLLIFTIQTLTQLI